MSADRSHQDILVIGPGWLGAPTAEALARTHAGTGRVWVLSRSVGEAPAGCHAIQGDVTLGADLTAVRDVITGPVAAIVVCIAPSAGRGDGYALYPAAARGAAALAEVLDARSVVYVSSTGVYDRRDGSTVDERALIAPASERVHALFDAELTMLASATMLRSAVVLRAAGLYGPGRDPGPRFASGATPGDTWCNFSWRDDVSSAIAHVLALPPSGQGVIFNCTDNHPVLAGDITQALTGTLPAATASPDTPNSAVRAGRSSQRVSSAALIATGWRPSVPTVFDGLVRLGHALPGRSA